jgi:CelD/BcsL family acetyltransferase involved in cellulose biosynthesis
MQIEVIDTLEGFEALREEWEALAQSSSCSSVFVSWPWQYHWWRNYREGAQLRILVARVDSQVTGILPLYIARKKLLGFVITSCCDLSARVGTPRQITSTLLLVQMRQNRR